MIDIKMFGSFTEPFKYPHRGPYIVGDIPVHLLIAIGSRHLATRLSGLPWKSHTVLPSFCPTDDSTNNTSTIWRKL